MSQVKRLPSLSYNTARASIRELQDRFGYLSDGARYLPPMSPRCDRQGRLWHPTRAAGSSSDGELPVRSLHRAEPFIRERHFVDGERIPSQRLGEMMHM